MKHLLMSILLTFSAHVFADALVMSNSAGGKIVLTKEVCHLDGGENFNIVYSWGVNLDITIKGCWTQENGYVFVLWESPSGLIEKIYELRQFEFQRGI